MSEKMDLHAMEFKSLSSPTLEFQNGDHQLVLQEHEEESRKELQKDDVKGDELEISSLESIKRPSLGDQSEFNEENDGFRTPTSLEHRIPLITKCPPAPRQPMDDEKSDDELKNSSLESIKRPSLSESEFNDVDNDGFRTPTSLDQRIPLMTECPPAPRKPKSRPMMKRKVASHRRIALDLSDQIDSLFPPALRADLEQEHKEESQKDGKGDDQMEISSLELIKKPSLGESKDYEDNKENDRIRTPTSLEHRFPLILESPPAPRPLMPSLGEFKKDKDNEENGGFRTPTSL